MAQVLSSSVSVLLFGNRGGGFSEEGKRGGVHRGWEGVVQRRGGEFFFFRGRNVHQEIQGTTKGAKSPFLESGLKVA